MKLDPILPFLIFSVSLSMASSDEFTLDSVRNSLIRQEDTIVFNLIERSKFPANSPIYDHSSSVTVSGFSASFLHFFVQETEALQAKVGRYRNPEEIPFFPDDLPHPLVPPHNYSRFLYPAAASININKKIWDIYFKQILPLFTVEGDDGGTYATTAAADLECLQALSRRIHYGKFVAEVKFRDAPHDYTPAIRAKDRDGLMKLLTFESVEEQVKKRVEKKAMVFGQDVTLDGKNSTTYKIEPSIVSHLYDKWVMPLTKLVQVEYLLHRLDGSDTH